MVSFLSTLALGALALSLFLGFLYGSGSLMLGHLPKTHHEHEEVASLGTLAFLGLMFAWVVGFFIREVVLK